MSRRLLVFLLVILLLTLGVGLFWFGAFELYATLNSMSTTATIIYEGRGAFYELLAGCTTVVLGAIILKVHTLNLKADARLMRVLVIWLVLAIISLVAVPALAGNFVQKQLKIAGYIQCSKIHTGLWSTNIWAQNSMQCLFLGGRRG
jgi:hypothetical protein